MSTPQQCGFRVFGHLALMLALSTAVRGAEPSVDYEDRVTQLEAQLATIQSHLAAAPEFASYSLEATNWVDDVEFTEPSGGFTAGAAILFTKPHFKEGFQISQTNLGTGQLTLIPFSYAYAASPRAWIGYTGANALGLRASYWQYDQAGRTTVRAFDGVNVFTAHATTIIFPAAIAANAGGETLVAMDGLETHVVDLEGTMQAEISGVFVTAGMGLRYASLQQTVAASVLGTADVLTWNRRYEGVGPTVSAEFKRSLGFCGLSAVGGGGGALLFGSKTLNRVVVGNLIPAQPPLLTLNDADEVVGIGELRLGLEWARCLSGGRELNIQGLYEGQLWAEAGAPTLGFLGFEGFALRLELQH